jgi:5-methylcytosine-specific restriction enzyme A
MLFKPGTIFERRSEIHDLYGGQRQGGISTPSNAPYVFLFTGETGAAYGYRDEFKEDGTFWYTGEGQVGDMQMIRGNKAIRDHKPSKQELHLFESLKDRRVRYIGQAEYITHHTEERPDMQSDIRKAIVFELGIEGVEENQSGKAPPEFIQVDPKSLWTRNMDELKSIAEQKSTASTSIQERRRIIYLRSEAVKIYALRRANGTCEGCRLAAPFKKKNGKPYPWNFLAISYSLSKGSCNSESISGTARAQLT